MHTHTHTHTHTHMYMHMHMHKGKVDVMLDTLTHCTHRIQHSLHSLSFTLIHSHSLSFTHIYSHFHAQVKLDAMLDEGREVFPDPGVNYSLLLCVKIISIPNNTNMLKLWRTQKKRQ